MVLPDMPVGAVKDVMMLTAVQVAVEVTLHELVAVTQILPLPVPEVTVMVLPPCPPVMVHPEGTVQA
jgi:hypothetical protein